MSECNTQKLATHLHTETVRNGVSFAGSLFNEQEIIKLSKNVGTLRGSEESFTVQTIELPSIIQQFIGLLGKTSVRGHRLLLPPGGALHTDGGTIRQGMTLLIPLDGETVPFYHTDTPRYYGTEARLIAEHGECSPLSESALYYGVGDMISLRQNYRTPEGVSLPPIIHGAHAHDHREVLAVDIHQL